MPRISQSGTRRGAWLPVAVGLAILAMALVAAPGFDAYHVPWTASSTVSEAASFASWNPNVACSADNVTLAHILGSMYPYESLSGSPYQTSSTTGGIPDKRALSPPCTITNVNGQALSPYVEVDSVYLRSYSFASGDCATTYAAVNGGGSYPNGQSFCDNVGYLQPVGTAPASNGFLHVEFDRDWLAKGFCGSTVTVCNNVTIKQEVSSGSISLDVQGFVSWFSSGSYWEIHPITGWRVTPAQGTPPPPLAANFTFSPSSPTVGQSVTFTASASGGTSPYSYAWTFGDGSTGTGATATHAFAAAGSYSVSLTVTDAASAKAGSTKTVTVSPAALSTSFSFSPASPVVGQTLTFTASASGGTPPYTFAWTFGDGGVGAGSSVTHAYSAAGTYSVTLTATDAALNTAKATQSVVVSPPSLAASFTFSPSSPVVGQNVTFTATATGGTSPYTYAWTFGDGGTGSGATAVHAYASAGTFSVTLKVTDAASNAVTSTQSITVGAAPLAAAFTFSPSNPTVGQSVTFTGSASGGTSPYTYAWTFGDGATGSGATATHAYTAAGTYAVNLTVTDAAGRKASAVHSVTVSSSAPGTDVSWNPNVVCQAAIVTLPDILGPTFPYENAGPSPYQTGSTSGGVPNKRALSPPCTIKNVNGQTQGSFVEIDGVWLVDYLFASGDCSTTYNAVNGGGSYPNGQTCDNIGDIETVGTNYPNNGYIHVEFDQDWLAKGFCGPQTTFCNNQTFQNEVSSGSISLDVQGFAYWDNGQQHWELHPFTAWRVTPSTKAKALLMSGLANGTTSQPTYHSFAYQTDSGDDAGEAVSPTTVLGTQALVDTGDQPVGLPGETDSGAMAACGAPTPWVAAQTVPSPRAASVALRTSFRTYSGGKTPLPTVPARLIDPPRGPPLANDVLRSGSHRRG